MNGDEMSQKLAIIPGFGHSEVVMKFTQIYGLISTKPLFFSPLSPIKNVPNYQPDSF